MISLIRLQNAKRRACHEINACVQLNFILYFSIDCYNGKFGRIDFLETRRKQLKNHFELSLHEADKKMNESKMIFHHYIINSKKEESWSLFGRKMIEKEFLNALQLQIAHSLFSNAHHSLLVLHHWRLFTAHFPQHRAQYLFVVVSFWRHTINTHHSKH